MRISNIIPQYQSNRQKTPIFNAWNREVFQVYGTGENAIKEVIRRNDTSIYRTPEMWKFLTNLIGTKYKDTSKVNVYNYGCSNGSEAYTFLIELLSKFDKKFADKFLPIRAMDCDPVAIKKAKSKILPINLGEQCRINENSNYKFSDFFENTGIYNEEEGTFNYRAKPILTDKVIIEEGNVLDDIKNINPENSIVFVRNFWPYLNGREREQLVKGLQNQLKKNCTIVIGDFDLLYREYNTRPPGMLINAGFKFTKNDMIYETWH